MLICWVLETHNGPPSQQRTLPPSHHGGQSITGSSQDPGQCLRHPAASVPQRPDNANSTISKSDEPSGCPARAAVTLALDCSPARARSVLRETTCVRSLKILHCLKMLTTLHAASELLQPLGWWRVSPDGDCCRPGGGCGKL